MDKVQAYVGDPDALDATASWPCTGPFRDRVVRYLGEHDVSALPER